jgi:HEAT repeat protein
MLDRLLHALVSTKNEAADDLLLQALRLGIESEQRTVLDGLLRRKTAHGLRGVLAMHDTLPESLQAQVMENLGAFHRVLAECGRGEDARLRLAAMRLIAVGRQGKLAYVLTENLHNSDESFSKAGCEGLVALARWVAVETRRIQKNERGRVGEGVSGGGEEVGDGDAGTPGRGEEGDAEADPDYERLMGERPEIEAAVARAINLHRGKHGPDLLRAALLLADWPGSRTLAIMQTPRHGGQSAMIRRLQQPPAAEHVEAFLLVASRGHLRAHFGSVFSHIDEAPVLDALLRKTHWLKDHQLQACLGQVSRGVWWGMGELARDLERRNAADGARIGDWIAAGGIHDVEQDERLELLLDHANKAAESSPEQSLEGRLRLLRIAMRRKKGSSVRLLRTMLGDADERIVRMAAREIVRRRPADFENMLLKLMAGAPQSVRRVVGRAIGQAGFEGYWQRFDKLDKATRQQAGKAMLKLLPDAEQRLHRRAVTGPSEQRVKALQIAQELGIAEGLRHVLVQLCADASARVRSKATSVLGAVPGSHTDVLIERLINDPDARVRANAIEVLEGRTDQRIVEILAERALAANGRERANAVKAMCRLKVSTAGRQLIEMLRDSRAEHRISALWALRQIGWWQLINEVGRLAKSDDNVRVRRYALGVLKNVAELLKDQKKVAG